MGHERWFRGQHDGQNRPFDWLTAARQHGIPDKLARALYEQAKQQAHGANQVRVQEIYFALLAGVRREAARPSPGKVTRTMRLQAREVARRRRPHVSPLTGQPVAPGKRPLTWYIEPAVHGRRTEEPLEADATSFRRGFAAVPADSKGALAFARVLDDQDQPDNAQAIPSRATPWSAQDIMVPGTVANRRFQASLVAALGYFEEFEALREEGIHPDPTAVEASQSREVGGRDTSDLEMHELPPPSESQLPFAWQARGALGNAWKAPVDDWPKISADPQDAGHSDEIASLLMEQSRGRRLEGSLAQRIALALGREVDHVEVHTDAAAAAAARSLDALAFTLGTHIFFGAGEWTPGTRRTDALLLHEMAHVIQGDEDLLPAAPDFMPASPGHALEQDAHRVAGMGMAFLHGGVVGAGATRPRSATRVQRPARGVAMRWWSGEYNPSDQSEIERRLQICMRRLIAAGVERDKLGRLEALLDWEGSRAEDRYRILQQVNRGSGAGGIGQPGRIVNAWNHGSTGLDQLRVHYATILHYVDEMERVAQRSMGMSWIESARYMSRNAQPRLAGATHVAVHPRALYFVSAAQAAMDIRSEAQQSPDDGEQGHYVAPGGFWHELQEISRQAATIAAGAQRQRRGQPPERSPHAGSSTMYNLLARRLRMIARALAAQESGGQYGPYHGDEHIEPDLRAFFDAARRQRVEQLAQAQSDEDAMSLAGEIVSLLDGVRGTERAHGAGGLDPHGREHGMGLAIDLYNGTNHHEPDVRRALGSNVTNKAPPDELWPVLPVLLEGAPDEFQPLREVVMRPGPSIGRFTPEEALLLSRFLDSEHVRQRLDALESGPASLTDEEQSLLGTQRATARQVVRQYAARLQILNQWRQRFAEGSELAEQRDALRERLALSEREAVNMSPSALREHVAATNQALARFAGLCRTAPEAQITPNRPWAVQDVRMRADELAPEATGRGRGARDLRSLHQWLVDNQAQLDTAASRRDAMNARESVAGIRDWLRAMMEPDVDPYDQPRVLVEGIDTVSPEPGQDPQRRDARGRRHSHFHGGHHWEVGRIEILQDDGRYVQHLRDDMVHRSEDELRRILEHMIQTPEGRLRVLGPDEEHAEVASTRQLRDEHPDPHLRTALQQAGKPTVEQLLPPDSPARAPVRVRGPQRSMVDFLRERGLYELAEELQNEVAGPPQVAAGDAGGADQDAGT